MQERQGVFGVVKRILQSLKEEKKTLVLLMFLSITAAGIDITVPVVIQRAIDAFVRSVTSKEVLTPYHVVFFGMGIFITTILGRVPKIVYDYNLFQFVTKLEDVFRNLSYGKFLNLHALYHHSNSSGQAMSRIDRGATGIFSILHDIIGQNLFIPLIYLVGVMGFLLIKDPFIAAVVFVPLPLFLFSVRHLAGKIYEIDLQAFDKFDLASKEQYDVASNAMNVKRFAQEEREIEYHRELRKEARKIQYSSEKVWAKIDVLQVMFGATGKAMVFVVAGLYVIWSRATIGELMLFMVLQGMVYQPIYSLSVLFPRLRRNVARVEKMFEIIDTPAEVIDKPDAAVLTPLKEGIRFKNLWFRYGENMPAVLKNISISIPSGSVTALVGRSGSGKTTFINLLMRAYDPTGGAILIDGVDIRTVTQKSLRDQIATVPQEVNLFSRSVAHNIRYGKPDATDEEVKSAARLALADGFISELENGYDTVVGERGLKLSGGERQRVGIASAIIKNPSILIFDEATSHLDTESEKSIKEAMESVTKNRTTIIIAHRLSTVLRADQIIVLDHGTVEAIGRHEELLQRSPIYKRLHELQFKN